MLFHTFSFFCGFSTEHAQIYRMLGMSLAKDESSDRMWQAFTWTNNTGLFCMLQALNW